MAAGLTPAAALQLDHIIVGGDLTLREVTIQQYFGEIHRPDSASRNRRAMIEKVWANWITGFLQPSLPDDILLELGLTERPAMVTRALDLYVQRPDLAEHMQASSTRLIDIFDRLDHALLILGAPGAGKTTLLLTLARELLMRAAQDPEQPIPVMFPLSSWTQQRYPLANWLVDALSEQYDVPRKLGQAWIAADAILPLLDGLDEVAPEHRAGCVEAINTFRHDHGLLPLAVCSRVADYEALGTRLRLPGAVALQPLTPAQVDSYLTQVGQPLAAVRDALQEDPTLWELLDTPLILTIVTLAYRGEPVRALPMHEPPEVQRHHLFAVYVDRMFQHRSTITLYTRQRTERWLTWLARAMRDHGQTIFYLEWIQPNWLSGQWQQWLVTLLTVVMTGLLCGLLAGLLAGLVVWLRNGLSVGLGVVLAYGQVCGLFAGLVSGLSVGIKSPLVGGLIFGLPWGLFTWRLYPLSTGLAHGLVGGLIAGLGILLVGYSKEIKPIEKIRWSWSAARYKWINKLTISLLYGLGTGLVIGLNSGLRDGLHGGLVVWLLCWLVVWLREGLTVGEIGTKSSPNEGIKRSLHNALIIGLGSWLLCGLGAGLAFGLLGGLVSGLLGEPLDVDGWQFFGLWFGLLGGLLIGLRFGGRAYLCHFVLRLVLWQKNLAPLNYIRFLDYATDRIFLRKVGGGYVFAHRMLLEYFAAKYQPSAERQNCNTNG